MFRVKVVLAAIVGCLCFTDSLLIADEADLTKKLGGSNTPTPLELSMLPPACIAKLSGDAEEAKKWRRILGSSYPGIHHYCFALNYLNRINRGIGDKRTLLLAALDNFEYMRSIPEDGILRPEVEYNIGQVLYQLDQIPQAMAALRKAIQLKSDYEQGYLLLSFCYRRLGDAEKAAEVLRTGLAEVPESKALQNALHEISSSKKEAGQTGPQ